MLKNFILFAIGIVVLAFILILLWTLNKYSDNWYYGSTLNFALFICLIVISSFICGFKCIDNAIGIIYYLLGIWISTPITMFILGFNNLWPIELIFNYIIITPISVAGFFTGFGIAFRIKTRKKGVTHRKGRWDIL